MAEWTSTASVADAESREMRDQLARAISNVFSPPVLSVPVLALGLWLADSPNAWRHAAVYLMVAVVVPLADLLRLLQTGRVSGLHLPELKDRRRPFVVTMLCTAVALGLLLRMGAPDVFVALIWAGLLQALILFFITLSWQVSIHSAAIASVTTLAVLALGPGVAGLLLLIPVVGWARVQLGRHTVAQVVAGAVVGSASLLVAMRGVLW